MIDKNKTYRTRDGREVRIYATDGHPDEPVHGAFKDNDGKWNQSIWMLDGKCRFNQTVGGHRVTDLIEVKPRIEGHVVIGIPADGGLPVLLQSSVGSCAGGGGHNRKMKARIMLPFSCEEGEGL